MKKNTYNLHSTNGANASRKIGLVCLLITLFTFSAFAQQSYFYGLTTTGAGGNGSVFRTDTTGQNFETMDSFTSVENGKRPWSQRLLEVNSKLYGVITNGGNNGIGVLFEYNPTNNNYVVKHHFSDSTGTNPAGNLLLASNGKIYGTTISGGISGHGTIFEFDATTGALTSLYTFNGPTVGFKPMGQLVEASPGKIYGVCENGSNKFAGTIYEFDIATKTITKGFAFDNAITGGNPQGGLMKANNGKLYGLTTNGGVNGHGTIFEYEIASNTVTNLHDFKGTADGATGATNLIQFPNGKLYGSTQYGGGSNKGILFEFDLALDSMTPKIGFGSTSIGYYPGGDMLETGTGTGKYLMLLRTGGQYSFAGTIAEYNSATNTMTKKVDFNRVSLGASPEGTLTKASINGKYYGLCGYGGTSDNGVIFEYDNATNTVTKKIDLSPSPMGKRPVKSLLLASNGKLYGVTKEGGNGYGTIFEVHPQTGKITKLADFDGTNGKTPVGALVQASNGKLYGNTQYGGSVSDFGVVYEFDIATNTITRLQNYTNTTGLYPPNGFLLASNGKLYTTTISGGGPNYGTIAEYDIANNTLTARANFDGAILGQSAYSNLMQAANGKIYGTTRMGGANGKGTVFEFNPTTGTLSALAHFNGVNGESPQGTLMEASNGKFYGMTANGNTSGHSNGVFYEFDMVNNTIIVKANLNRFVHGYGGYGEFVEGKNGKLYGLSAYGSGGIGAVVLEYDITQDTLIAKSDTRAQTEGTLVQVEGVFGVGVKNIVAAINVVVYPNPAQNILHISTDSELKQVDIFTMDGKSINMDNTPINNNSLDVSTLTNGIYLVKIVTEKGVAFQKIMIQR